MSKYSEKVKRRKTDRVFTNDRYAAVKVNPRKRCKICGLKIRGEYENHILGESHQAAVKRATA